MKSRYPRPGREDGLRRPGCLLVDQQGTILYFLVLLWMLMRADRAGKRLAARPDPRPWFVCSYPRARRISSPPSAYSTRSSRNKARTAMAAPRPMALAASDAELPAIIFPQAPSRLDRSYLAWARRLGACPRAERDHHVLRAATRVQP